jgi:hypothetical protein
MNISSSMSAPCATSSAPCTLVTHTTLSVGVAVGAAVAVGVDVAPGVGVALGNAVPVAVAVAVGVAATPDKYADVPSSPTPGGFDVPTANVGQVPAVTVTACTVDTCPLDPLSTYRVNV